MFRQGQDPSYTNGPKDPLTRRATCAHCTTPTQQERRDKLTASRQVRSQQSDRAQTSPTSVVAARRTANLRRPRLGAPTDVRTRAVGWQQGWANEETGSMLDPAAGQDHREDQRGPRDRSREETVHGRDHGRERPDEAAQHRQQADTAPTKQRTPIGRRPRVPDQPEPAARTAEAPCRIVPVLEQSRRQVDRRVAFGAAQGRVARIALFEQRAFDLTHHPTCVQSGKRFRARPTRRTSSS